MTDSNGQTMIALGLGSNIGDRVAALRAAVAAIASYVEISSVSQIYESASAYVGDQPVYLNAVLIGKTKLEPLALLWFLKNIESDIGRAPSFRHGPHFIDIDIIFYGDSIVKTVELTIPHQAMSERNFVLQPLNDLAPEWQHPVTHKTVAEMLAELPENNMSCLGKIL